MGIRERRSVEERPAGDVDAPSVHLHSAFRDQLDGERVEEVLLTLDAGVQCGFGVVGPDRDGGLREDWTVIGELVHEVYRHARDPSAVCDRLPLRVQPGEGRQQRGMYVQYPHGECLEQHGRDETHEPCEYDELGPVLVQHLDEACVIGGS